jgi:hypothetical protein
MTRVQTSQKQNRYRPESVPSMCRLSKVMNPDLLNAWGRFLVGKCWHDLVISDRSQHFNTRLTKEGAVSLVVPVYEESQATSKSITKVGSLRGIGNFHLGGPWLLFHQRTRRCVLTNRIGKHMVSGKGTFNNSLVFKSSV